MIWMPHSAIFCSKTAAHVWRNCAVVVVNFSASVSPASFVRTVAPSAVSSRPHPAGRCPSRHSIGVVGVRTAVRPVGLGHEGVHPQLGLLLIRQERVDRGDQLVAVGAVRNGLADLEVAQDRVRRREVLSRSFDDLLDFLGHDLLDFLDRLDDLGLDDLDLFLDDLGHDLLDNLGRGRRTGSQDHADDHEDAKQHGHLLQ